MADIDPRGGPIQGKVMGHFFGLFHGCTQQHFQKIVASAPFDRCNLLILAFLGINQRADGAWVPVLTNGRDNCFNGGRAKAGDTDDDRIKLVMDTARAANRDVKILISFGYCNEVIKASKSPEAFANGLAAIVQKYGLDGFDIDWEQQGKLDLDGFTSSHFATLMDHVTDALRKVVAQPILTICPAIVYAGSATDPLMDRTVLGKFTYVMPQTYQHGGIGTRADDYALKLGGYSNIVYGINGEGYVNPPTWDPLQVPDDPRSSWQKAISSNAAGVFSWRLDTDSMRQATAHKCDTTCAAGECDLEGDLQLPTYATAKAMWQLMLGHRDRAHSE